MIAVKGKAGEYSANGWGAKMAPSLGASNIAESNPGGRVRGVSHMSRELIRRSACRPPTDGQRITLFGAAAGIRASVRAIAGRGK
jgi:hypothetical protein